jgi:hypothetical protein
MAVLKRYNTSTSLWEPILIGEPGPPGPPGSSIYENFAGYWDEEYEYQPSDVVWFNGIVWQSALPDNLGNTPSWPDIQEGGFFWFPLTFPAGSTGQVLIEYRESEYQPDGFSTALGNVPASHVYEFSDEDLAKGVVVQRTEPYEEGEEEEFPGAKTLYLVMPYGVGEIGDRIEVAYTPTVVENISSGNISDLQTLLFDFSVNAFLFPFKLDTDENDVAVSGTIVLGDAIPLLLNSVGTTPEKWPPTSLARLTKVKTITTNLGGQLVEPIPVDVWAAEIRATTLLEFSLPTFGS